MRIDGTGRVGTPQASGGSKRSTGAGFSLPTGPAPRETTGTRGAAPVSGLDSMLALQAVEDPLQRRRRGVKRGGAMLDALDSLKIALLDGVVDHGQLQRLQSLVTAQREGTGDPALEAVLDEIELRAAVEVAKRQARGAR
jgi:hypothetical protein